MALKNLDIYDIKMLGMQPASNSWTKMLSEVDNFFSGLPLKKFQNALAHNISNSYSHLMEFSVKDLDTDLDYCVFFDNNRTRWDVKFKDTQSDSLVLPNEKFDILRNDDVKKLIAKACETLKSAKNLIEKYVLPHIESGELLEVDDVKLEAELSFLNDQHLMENFKLRKYAKN